MLNSETAPSKQKRNNFRGEWERGTLKRIRRKGKVWGEQAPAKLLESTFLAPDCVNQQTTKLDMSWARAPSPCCSLRSAGFPPPGESQPRQVLPAPLLGPVRHPQPSKFLSQQQCPRRANTTTGSRLRRRLSPSRPTQLLYESPRRPRRRH